MKSLLILIFIQFYTGCIVDMRGNATAPAIAEVIVKHIVEKQTEASILETPNLNTTVK